MGRSRESGGGGQHASGFARRWRELDASVAGQVASVLLVLAGLVTMASVALPEPTRFNRTAVVLIGAAAASLGAALVALPWRRWSARVSLVLVAPAFVLIGLHNWFGGQDAYRYSIFFLVVFVWVGSFHPRGTSLAVAVPATATYLAPMLVAHAPAYALASTAYAVPIFVVVGEVLAWKTKQVSVLESELREAALHDPLTGLANRRLAVDRLEVMLAAATRSGEFVHVLYVDIDNFKTINDRFGHDAGDAQLCAVASTLAGVVRPPDLVARFAGDEFVIVLTSRDVDAGRRVAERVVAAVHERRFIGGRGMPTVSVGVATSEPGELEIEPLLESADRALYQAKADGRDTLVVATGRGAA
jgi:diguanylate cyclase (GGDEF)-like protein